MLPTSHGCPFGNLCSARVIYSLQQSLGSFGYMSRLLESVWIQRMTDRSKAQKWPIGSDVLKFDAKSVRMFWATNKREPKSCSLNNKGTAVLCHEQNGAGHFLSCIIQMNYSIIKDLCSLHLNILPFSFYWSWLQLAPFFMPRWLYLLQASQCSHSNAQGCHTPVLKDLFL